jgi:hypothetical protein
MKINYKKITKFENEIVIFELSLELSRDDDTIKWSCKNDIQNFLQRIPCKPISTSLNDDMIKMVI